MPKPLRGQRIGIAVPEDSEELIGALQQAGYFGNESLARVVSMIYSFIEQEESHLNSQLLKSSSLPDFVVCRSYSDQLGKNIWIELQLRQGEWVLDGLLRDA